jgi:ubiquinone/menaquinone biosynthesis C-methylase UbiE
MQKGVRMNISAVKLNKKDIVDVYSRTAFIYDIWGMLTETKARQRAIALAKIRNGEAVLEVATGTGLTFLEMLKANPQGENFGVDLTPAMLDKARQKSARSGVSNYQLSVGDAYSLQFPDQRFDLLMNNYMFDLLPEKDFQIVLKEFKRVLKPGGRIVLVNMTRSEHLHHQIWEGVYHINPRWLGGCRGVLLLEQVKAAGFQDVYRETISQFSFPSEIIRAIV